MTNLSDDKQISLLSIPGSHDSGARHSIVDIAGICQDLTIDELARLTGLSVMTVRRRLHEAKLIMTERLEEQI